MSAQCSPCSRITSYCSLVSHSESTGGLVTAPVSHHKSWKHARTNLELTAAASDCLSERNQPLSLSAQARDPAPSRLGPRHKLHRCDPLNNTLLTATSFTRASAAHRGPGRRSNRIHCTPAAACSCRLSEHSIDNCGRVSPSVSGSLGHLPVQSLKPRGSRAHQTASLDLDLVLFSPSLSPPLGMGIGCLV